MKYLTLFYPYQIFKSSPDEVDAGSVAADGTATVNRNNSNSTMNHSGSLPRPVSTMTTSRDGTPWGPSSRIYANQAPVHPSRAGAGPPGRPTTRPTPVINRLGGKSNLLLSCTHYYMTFVRLKKRTLKNKKNKKKTRKRS